MVLQGELRVPDAPAEQGRILHHGLRKAVVAAPEHLAVGRLLHAPAGEFFGVDHGAVGEPVQQQDGLADEGAGEDLVHIVLAVHLAEGDAAVNKGLHVRYVPLRRQGRSPAQQEGGDALNHAVVSVAVNHVEPALPRPDVQVAADDVIVAPHAQEGVQRLLVFAELTGQLFHSLSSAAVYLEVV